MHRGRGQAGRRGWRGGLVRLLPVQVLLLDLHVSESRGPQCGCRMSRSLYVPMYLLDCTLLFVTPLLVATVLCGLTGRVLFRSVMPHPPHRGAGRCQAWQEPEPTRSCPGGQMGARWGPQVLQEAGG